MNARTMGDWLVWESPDTTTHTLRFCELSYAHYRPAEAGVVAIMRLYRGDKLDYHQLAGEDAEWFHNYWMKYLEEEERLVAQIRKADEEWQAREAGPDTPPGP